MGKSIAIQLTSAEGGEGLSKIFGQKQDVIDQISFNQFIIDKFACY